MRLHAQNDSATLKVDIQAYVREIVILRDGGCWARNESWHRCNGYRKDGELILQADHMVTRANSATYADTRLIVCVCKGLHGWKKWNEKEYDKRLKPLLSPERVALWEAASADRYRPVRMGAYDWQMEIVNLKRELLELQK